MNEVYSNARDRVAQAIYDHITNTVDPGAYTPGIDWFDAREYDPMADKVLEALWGGASANMPLIHAQFSTGGETGLRATQPVDVLKVEAQDDGSLTVTLNYWPKPDVVMPTFEKAWEDCKSQGFNYGPDALESVKLGWDLAVATAKWPKEPTIEPARSFDELAKRLVQRVEAEKEKLLEAWLAQTGVMPTDAVLVTCNDYIHDQVRQKFWVERKVPTPDFDAVKDKRMSELTDAQKDDAMELWLRNNVGWFGMGGNYAGRHIAFLLKRIDEMRGVK